MHAESFFGCIVGKMAQLRCRNGVNVFSFGKLFFNLFLLFFLGGGLFLEMVRQKRGGKGEMHTL